MLKNYLSFFNLFVFAFCLYAQIDDNTYQSSQSQQANSTKEDKLEVCTKKVTAVILNEARVMVRDIWDGETPIRQIGLGVSKLTHENAFQLSLFEDPKLDYYREWDRKYDEQKAQNEDARILAYERKR